MHHQANTKAPNPENTLPPTPPFDYRSGQAIPSGVGGMQWSQQSEESEGIDSSRIQIQAIGSGFRFLGGARNEEWKAVAEPCITEEKPKS